MDQIKATRNGDEKLFSRAAWDNMVEKGATYGWVAEKVIPAELAQLKAAPVPEPAEEIFPDLLDEIKAEAKDPEPLPAEAAPEPAKAAPAVKVVPVKGKK
jgi:hypothetical protein